MTVLYIKPYNILRFACELVSKWFEQNYTVLNVDKYHFICPAKDTENRTFIFNNSCLITAMEIKYLGLLLAMS